MSFNPFAAGGGAGGDYVHNYTTFDDLGIDTHGKTMEEILKEVADMNLPVNTIITGQLYTEAAPDERIYNCEGEIQITQGKYGQVYWCRATSASISPYSWDSIYNQTTDEDNPIDNILPWTPTYYQSTEINEIKKKLEELGADWVGRFERDEDGNILGEYFNDYENNKATGLYSHTEGSMNVNLGETGHVEGYNNQLNSTEKGSHVEGWENIVKGECNHTEGRGNKTYLNNIHVEGIGNQTQAYDTTAMPDSNGTHIEGTGNRIEGSMVKHSHMEGAGNLIAGTQGTHIEGTNNSIPNGGLDYGHIEGIGNRANVGNSDGVHIEGINNFTIGNSTGAHLGGIENALTGTGSTVFGGRNYANTKEGTTSGFGNINIGAFSDVKGLGNISYGSLNFIEGGFNPNAKTNYFYSCNVELTNIKDATYSFGNISLNKIGNEKKNKDMPAKSFSTKSGSWPTGVNGTYNEGIMTVCFYDNGTLYTKRNYYCPDAEHFILGDSVWPSSNLYDTVRVVGVIPNFIGGNISFTGGNRITGTTNAIYTTSTADSYDYGGTVAYKTSVGFHSIEGVNNIIIGQGSGHHIEGGTNVVSGTTESFCHAEGNNNTMKNSRNAHIEGDTNVMYKADNTHVEGCNNVVNNSSHSHIEGVSNTIGSTDGIINVNDTHTVGAHVEGSNNRVYATSGHAEGGNNTVLGKDSHAEGYNNTVYGKICHVSGSGNSVNGEGNFVCGMNVITASDSAYNFILGVNNNNSVGSKNYGNLMCLSNSSVSSSYNVGLLQAARITGGYNLVIGTQAGIDAETSILNMTQSNLRGAHFSYVNGYNNNITNKGSSTSQNSVCWIHGSLNNIIGGNTCLYGRQNDIYGYSNYILGDKNETSYSTDEKKADAIYNNYIFGSRNILYSDKTRVSENNKIFGDNNFIDGNDNIILEASEKQDTLSLTSSVSISSCDSGTITLSSEWPDIDKYPIETIFEISGYAIIVQLSSKTTLKVLKWYDGQDRDISEVLTGKSFNSIIPIKVFSNNSSGLFVVGGKNIAIAPENGRSGRSVLIHSSNYTEDFGGANVVINANNVSLQQSGSNIIFGKGSSTNFINMTYGSSGNIVYQHRSDSYANFSYVCEGNVSYGQEVNLTHASNNFISPAADRVSIGNIPVGEKNKNVILSCNEFKHHYDTIQKISSNTILNGDTHTINGSFNVCGVGSSDIVGYKNVDFGEDSVIKNRGWNIIFYGSNNKILSGKYIADDNYNPDDTNRTGQNNAAIGNNNTIYASCSYAFGDGNTIGIKPTENDPTPFNEILFSMIIGTGNQLKAGYSFITGAANAVVGSSASYSTIHGTSNTIGNGSFNFSNGVGNKVYGMANFTSGQSNNIGEEKISSSDNVILGSSNTVKSDFNKIMGNGCLVKKGNQYIHILGNSNSVHSKMGANNLIAGTSNNIYKNAGFSSIFGAGNIIGQDEEISTGTDYDVSHVFIAGQGLAINAGKNKTILGCYNAIDTEDKFALVIGNGTAEDARSNAFAVSKTGDIYVKNSDTPIDLTPVPMSLLEEICV